MSDEQITQDPEVKKLSSTGKMIYQLLDQLGITSGITIVTVGVLCVIWSLYNSSPEQVLLSAILVALGVVIMERHKFELD